MPTAQGQAQTGILTVNKARLLEVGIRVAPPLIAREHHHVGSVSLSNSPLHGYAVDNSSIEHGNAIHHHNATHIGQAARSTQNVDSTLARLRLSEIHRTPRKTIRCHHFEGVGMLKIFIKIYGDEMIGKLIIEQIAVENAPLLSQMAQTNVMITRQIINIGYARAPGLPTHIAHAITRSRRNSNYIAKINGMLHQGIEHTTCEHATHAATFQN